MNENLPVQSFADANRELLASFDRYMESRGNSPETRRSYARSLTRLVEALGAQSVLQVERFQIRELFLEWDNKGLHPNSMRLYTCAFRAFFKFLRMAGLTKQDPSLQIQPRKIPGRVPIVLTVDQVSQLAEAAQDPFERAVVEVLYGTGVRISEFINLRLEDIGSGDPSPLRVHDGKGGKDRVVLLGSFAVKAIEEYQQWRPSKHGYVFEAPPRIGTIRFVSSRKGSKKGYWHASFYVKGVQTRAMSLGPLEKLPTKADARAFFERMLHDEPGFKPKGERPYNQSAIRVLLNRLALHAGIDHVHPHALRRAMASHMLQRGADLRVVQELLGHERLTTTMRYTALDAEDLRKVYEKAHPHAKGEPGDDEGK